MAEVHHDDWQEDSVTLKKVAEISLDRRGDNWEECSLDQERTLVGKVSGIGLVRPCDHCARLQYQLEECRSKLKDPECRPVAVQTEPPNAKQTVPVPGDHLAMLQKYYMAVKDAYYNYALTDGDAKEVLRRLFEQTPEVLCAVNQQGQSPIESALSQGKWAAGAQLLELAGRRNARALGHRMATGQDALMLAVEGGSEATIRQLVSLGCGRSACIHYNGRGQNALHLSALGSSSGVLEILLADLSQLCARGQLSQECATAALTTNDCDGYSPLHYMARGNRVQMLTAVHEFARDAQLSLDWDSRQGAGPTPLTAAAEADALGACEFLLRHGLAGIDLAEQRDLWMVARLSDPVRGLLAQHCPLLGPMSALPQGNLTRLQAGLQERGLTEEFLLQLRSRLPALPQLPSVVPVLAVCQSFCGSSRLVVWDILSDLGTGDLARLLEA